MLIGPPNQNWALGLVAVFAVRIGELGERQHRYIASAHITDVRIPVSVLSTCMCEFLVCFFSLLFSSLLVNVWAAFRKAM